jgi:uncharacterized membrane protein
MPEISEFCPGCGRSVGAPEALRAADSREALLAALAYLVAPAIVFLAVPALHRSRFVRFHSWQSIFFVAAAAVAALVMKLLFGVFSVLPAIGLLLAWLCVGGAGPKLRIAGDWQHGSTVVTQGHSPLILRHLVRGVHKWA